MSDAPRIDFSQDVKLPGLPTGKDGKPMASVLGNEAEREKAFALFQDMWNRAGNPPPVLDGDGPTSCHGKMDVYKAAERAYNNNPLAARRAAIEQKYSENKAGQPKESLDKIYKDDVKELAAAYMNGVDRGVQDSSLDAKRQSAFMQAVGGDIPGALKSLFMTIPVVGDYMAAFGKMVMSFFTSMFDKNTKAIGFTEALQQIKLEKSFGGAAAALGAQGDSPMFGLMVNEGKGAFASKDFKPTEAVGAPKTAPAKNAPQFTSPAPAVAPDTNFPGTDSMAASGPAAGNSSAATTLPPLTSEQIAMQNDVNDIIEGTLGGTSRRALVQEVQKHAAPAGVLTGMPLTGQLVNVTATVVDKIYALTAPPGTTPSNPKASEQGK